MTRLRVVPSVETPSWRPQEDRNGLLVSIFHSVTDKRGSTDTSTVGLVSDARQGRNHLANL